MIRKDIKLYTVVKLLENLPKDGFRKGLIGTVIYTHIPARIFEVEIATEEGSILEIVTLEAFQIEPLSKDELKTLKKITLFTTDEQ